jgi:hypothetical protein
MNIIHKIRYKIAAPLILQREKELVLAFKQKEKEYDLIPINYTLEQDIFVCGYPKSGNTWMQNLLVGVIYGITTEYLPDALAQKLIPDVHYEQYYRRYLNFAVFKSHHLPMPEYKKVIHLIRDGRDAMVSYYAMNKASGINYSLAEMVIEGKGIMSKWNEHTQQWLNNPYGADILVVRYEDLLINPSDVLLKICSFIGIERDIDLIKRAISGNTFAKMQEKENTFGKFNSNYTDKNYKFFRKGKIGSYKDEMPKNLIHYFEKESKNQLAAFGYL